MFQFPEKIKKIFKEDNLQEEFEKNGFVILDFYTSDEVQYLLNLYRELHPQDEKGFFPSTFSKDKNYRITADEEIRKVGNRSIENYLTDITIVCGSFIVKFPGEDSVMNVHQDMTLIDESEFTGVNIWCPLIDLTDTNGLLYALPGSHRIFPTYRGSSVPTIYQDVYDDVKKYSKPIYLKAGQAIFFDQSILHWSKPNLSSEVRPVTNTYFTNKNARFQTCYYDKEKYGNKVEIFSQNDSFMTDFEQFGDNIYDRPIIGVSRGLFDYNFPLLTKEHLESLYKIDFENSRKSFFEIYTPSNVLREIKLKLGF
jgi:hypothetical protein